MALKLPSAMHGFRLLTCSDDDLFQIIDSAIVVASLRCPQELKIQKDCILQRLFDPPKAYTANDSDGSEITDHHHGNCGTVSHASSKQVLDGKVSKKNVKVDVNGSESTGAKKTIKIKSFVRKASKIPQNLGQESNGGARKDVEEFKIPQNLGQESGGGARKDVEESKIPQNPGQESGGGARKDVEESKIPQNFGQESSGGARQDIKESKIPQNLGQESSGGAREDVKESKIPQNLGEESSDGARKDVKASKIPQNLGHESSGGDLLDQEILGEPAAPDLNCPKKTQPPALSVNKKRDLLDYALLQEKVEASKRKLHEGYQRFQDAKNKKRTRLIDFRDAPIMPPADAKRPKRFHSSFC